ncbi:galanin receptor 2b-like [Lytechinus pictus]|uniref:galanin receptor 2b-like n=1 Tax=Lytechinus pictus TaxID=7653 RepID=UPI0030B9D5F5
MTDFMNLTESVTYFVFDDVSGTDYNNSSDEGGGGGGGGGDGGYGGKPMIWVILEALIGFLGVLGNGLVLFVFFKDKSLRNLINSFIINQSIIDFTTSFVFLLICFLPKSTLDPTSLANLIFCQIWASEYVLWALFISSSLNLVSITLDRYCAIIYPAKYRSSAKKLKRRIKLISVVTWSSGFVLDCYWPAIHVIHPIYGCIPGWTNKIMQGVIGVFIFFITYAGPLGVMGFSYIRILSKLRRPVGQPAPTMSSNSTNSNTGDRAMHPPKKARSERSERASRNVIKTMLTVSLTYAICWAPIAFNYLVYNLGGPLDFQGIWYAVTKIFVYANLCANPFIYTMQYQQFQKGFERAFKVKIFKGLPDSADPTKTQPSAASEDRQVDVSV